MGGALNFGELLDSAGLELLPVFATSLAIGLLIGLERERNPYARAGLRTIALTTLFGTLIALLAKVTATPWLPAAGLLAVSAMIMALGGVPMFRQCTVPMAATGITAAIVCAFLP